MDKYTGLTNGILRLLREDERHNSSNSTYTKNMLLFIQDNIRYTQPENRCEVAGHVYNVLRHDFLCRQGTLTRAEADKLVSAFMDGGMTRTEIEEMLCLWQDDELQESYGIEYRNFVGITLAALLQLTLKESK